MFTIFFIHVNYNSGNDFINQFDSSSVDSLEIGILGDKAVIWRCLPLGGSQSLGKLPHTSDLIQFLMTDWRTVADRRLIEGLQRCPNSVRSNWITSRPSARITFNPGITYSWNSAGVGISMANFKLPLPTANTGLRCSPPNPLPPHTTLLTFIYHSDRLRQQSIMCLLLAYILCGFW